MENYDTSHLTEFPRFESESSQSSVSTFFNKFWKLPLFTPSEGGENGQDKSSGEEKQDSTRPEDEGNDEYVDVKTETGTYAVELEGRSLPNVLRRISSLVALGSGGGTRYADTELARYWMPDDISRECYECATRFSTLRRRHHCRVCGQIFCSRCCSQRVPGHIFGCNGGLRVCNYCCNVVLSYLKENDPTGEISPDLRTLQENLQVKFPDNKDRSLKPRDNFVFAHEQEERCEPRSSPKETLLDVFRQLSFALPTQQHRYRLVSYNGVWRGCDVLQWITDNTHNKTRAQANMICQSLLSSGYMECVTDLPQFADYALYRPRAVPRDNAGDDDDDDEQLTTAESPRLVESVSSYCLDLNLGDKSARIIKTPKPEKKSSSSEEEAPVVEQNEGYTESKHVCRAISESGAEHLRLLLRQCLARAALPPAWLEPLLPLCVQAADAVTPDPQSDDIDVRNYVQVKKVPGGAPRDSCLVHGVVLTKNVAHRGMPQQISNPSILLLDCSIAYQRVEGKLTSLEPVLMQENEYLTRCAARITALRPSVVLVRGTAGRVVQAALRRAGAALALRVPPRALRRAARCSAADMLTSIDARIGRPRLGTCNNFYVKNYESKTLMVLEGCAAPQLGCCILLRGATQQELIRVKKVVKFMLLACYNWKLEKAFLGDIDAILPEPGMTFDDEIDDQNDDNSDVIKTDDTNQTTLNLKDQISLQKDISNDIFTNESAKSNEANDIFDINFSSETSDIESSTEKADVITTEKSEVSLNTDIVLGADNSDILSIDTDDPLQRPKSYTRKTENLSCGVPIRDFSDPLRATLSVDDDVFLPIEEGTLKADAQNERWSADDMVLSMSPTVLIPAPYLETEAGRRCPLRACFPAPLLRAAPPLTPRLHTRASSSTVHAPQPQNGEYHPFVRMAIRTSADDMTLRAALASYRAVGGRPNSEKHKPSCPQYNPSVIRKLPKESEPNTEKPPEPEPLDPFAPESHQQLHLLLYSFSNKSPNVPDFCVNPWVVVMEMYGRHDISLGAFLQKYCFSGDYKCTSTTCHVPMNQHVRRFVHGDVCITITCNTIGHSSVDKAREENSKQVSLNGFVHGDVCITITWNTIGHSSVDKAREENSKQVSLNGFVHSDVCITITWNTIGHSSVDKAREENSKQVSLNGFVHGDVCITITWNTIGHSSVDKAREENSKQVSLNGFVHGDVCITITWNTIGHSSVDKAREENSKQVSLNGFVHGDVCITITWNTIGHSSVDKAREENSKQVSLNGFVHGDVCITITWNTIGHSSVDKAREENSKQVSLNGFVHGDVCITVTWNTIGHSSVDKAREENSKQVSLNGFVHGDVCITITCNTIGHSSVDKAREENSKQVMFWSRCEQCGATGRARRLSPAALALSLAAYVRWRVSPARAMRSAACPHALHACVHAFQAGLTTACFKYSKIRTYDIVLPPELITTHYDTKQMRDTLIAQLNELMLKGHETFNNVGSGEADKEYQAFKHHMENLHVALTSPVLQDPDTDAVVQSLWNISDGIISGEKMLRDAQDKWSSPPAKPTKQQPETPVEDKSDIDESSGEASGNENIGTTYVFSSDNSTKESEREHTGTEEDEEKGDKKTVRQILSQLLSNNQPANQAGMIVCSGLVPVVVQATQTGSVIAAALASATYRRARTHHRQNTQTELEDTDSTGANKDKTDGDKSKASKSNEHVEVLLKDGLVCRVYYAAQFQALRHAVVAPRGRDYECCCDNDKKLCNIEEGFIRSLAQCVPWAARGGKSGSTFCKTKDDRYVLKEMTKPEWQQFLEFAPHYFNYVMSCRQNKVPSLLARILGVYSVGGAGSGVLVMENVWYCAGADHTRFDLKGSSRHRLASQAPRAVLMDENLLNLRWERPLHVRGHAGRALWACMRRDTAFLAAHGVMDYSLLLALGDNTLVLGVIDYIRTFTWDKKLEHLVKKNLGSGQPTVVSPEQYMKRFCAAARKYFLQCPEHWDHLYSVLPSMLGQ